MSEHTEAAHADLLAAITEALSLPLPSIAAVDERDYHRLLERRVLAVRTTLEANRSHTRDPRLAANLIRIRTAEEPVTYTPWKGERDGGAR
ncbi:hypothetical protein ACFV0H_35225 [Streptomyces erythrochromogenes]|uniref:hypothetical protein n=1 Tax=Streptomyces erythrochromogenes TaxID=285574 RepID=UPI0036AF904C